ncbi:DALR-1 domain-containing protein [Mycena chlorophos]|uniref:arginine--tRNA ligase n=1 Tax=Mycena chlorophos TaxID=658473 RepID=A0A8H6WGN4_MYCCL|nr:DALR-1 domain-containing protein [Mycena chlorophos]
MPPRPNARFPPDLVAAVQPSVPDAMDEVSKQLLVLRTHWKWASLSQFLYTFSPVLNMDEVSLADIEDDLVRGSRVVLPRVMTRLLFVLSGDRKVTLDTWQSALRKQYKRRDPDANPIGPEPASSPRAAHFRYDSVHSEGGPSDAPSAGPDPELEPEPEQNGQDASKEEETKDWLDLSMLEKLDSMQQVTEWLFHNPMRLRTLMKSDDEDATWRIEPIGYDAKSNAYWLIGADRLWIQRTPPRPPRAKPSLKRKRLPDESPKRPKPKPAPAKRARVEPERGRTAKARAKIKLETQAKELEELNRAAAAATGKRSARKAAAPPRALGTRLSARLRGTEDEDEWQTIPDEWLSDEEPPSKPAKTGLESGDSSSELTELSEEESEVAEEPETVLPAPDFVEWETICVTLYEWEHIAARFESGTHYTEKALYKVLTQHIVPVIAEELREIERKRRMVESVVHRKRSSRIAIKEQEKEAARQLTVQKVEATEKKTRAQRLEARIATQEVERSRREAARDRRRQERDQDDVGTSEGETVPDDEIDVVGEAEPEPPAPAPAPTANGHLVDDAYDNSNNWMLNCEICGQSGLNMIRFLVASRLRVPVRLYAKMAYSAADPSTCALDAFRSSIAQRVSAALSPLTVDQVYSGVDYGKKGVDFTIALPRFKMGKPDDLAAKVLAQFQPDEYIESVTHDKAFLHFQCTSTTLIRDILTQVHTLTHLSPTPCYGSNASGKGKKVLIEYSSPNIAKSFHVGHLRSTIIGAFLANLYKSCGWDVVSLNYLGDWGTQFGLILAGYEKYGSEEELQKDAIQHLLSIYVQVNKDAETDPEVKVEAARWFKRMEDGDEAALKNWRVWRELSVKKYAEEYERLNVAFDEYTGESQVGQEWQDKALARLEEMSLIEEDNGARKVNLEQWKMGKPVLRKRDGTSIYLTRDIGAAIERYEKYKFDKMIYVIASQQDLHVAQFFKIIDLMQFPWAKTLEHVNYGLVQGMSTRRGTVVFLDQIIREAGQVMHEQMQKNEEKYAAVEDPETVSREIGITGVKIQDMAAKRINNYTFNWDRMKSFEGDTGPYLQYAHVRLSSMSRKNPELLPLPHPSQIDVSSLAASSHAREIVFLLGSYPDVVKVAMKTYEPSGVVTFLFRLSHAISSAWEVLAVKGEPDLEKARARLWMYECARDVLGSGMRLLSIRPLDRM